MCDDEDENCSYSHLFLNDEVINTYMDLIKQRSPDTVYTFNTFFYQSLSEKGYKSVVRWTKKIDVFSKQKLFIPVHLGEDFHWCLVCVDFKEKAIKYYDSLGARNFKCLKLILFYLILEHIDKKNKEFVVDGWLLINVKDCPQQENVWDCGVFVCMFAEYLSRNAPLDFSQKDMVNFRKQLFSELKDKKLKNSVLED